MQFFVAEAQKSLLKKIQGYEVEESKITYVDSGKPVVDENGKEKQKPKIKEKTIVKKHIQPDTAAIIFTLTMVIQIVGKTGRILTLVGLLP